MWICPECGRKFSRNNQSHSCEEYHPEDIFIGKGEMAVLLYKDLTARVMGFGEVEIHTGKWNFTVRRLSTFLTIMVEKNHLTLIFISQEPVDEFPVYQSHYHSGNRFSNAVKIESVDEIDDELLGWLKQAWELAG